MKLQNNYFYCRNDEATDEIITQFKKVAISPQNKSFLSQKIVVQNYCVMYIESGHFEWKLNNLPYKLTPNDLILVCPGVEMEKEIKYLEYGNFYKISLNLNLLLSDGHSEDLKTIVKSFTKKNIVILKNCHLANEIFNKLEDEFTNEEIGYRTRICGLIDELIIGIYRTYQDKAEIFSDKDLIFEKITSSLKANLSYNWSVKEMAALSNMGVTKFSTMLKTEYGYSPFDYLIYLRINEAVRLLKETSASVTSIALDTGFYSSQHFSNSFKKIFGETPSKYRKN